MTDKKPKIEAIYPLSSVQQGLLFHHLMQGEDQGFLTVQCTIEGVLDTEKLQEAWQLTVKRHEIMRTSAHWKKLEKAMLVVRPQKEIEWSFLDWRNQSTTQIVTALKNYKAQLKVTGANLEKNPLSKISIIQKTADSYYFLWACHHLFLDGWSSAIIIRDAFAMYNQLITGKLADLPAIPSQKAYNKWFKNEALDKAANFWKKTLEGYAGTAILEHKNNTVSNETPSKNTYVFDKNISEDLKTLARSYKVTLNTLFQGIWSLALSKFFSTKDVVFGNTVSGRSVPFENINLMAGMFANVIPVRANFTQTETFQHYLQNIQNQQQEARNFEYSKQDEIISWANLPEDKPLFDSLFVFENFPWQDIHAGNLIVKGFESGITTTYPVTAIFKIEDCIEYNLLTKANTFAKETTAWFLEVVPAITNILLEKKEQNIAEVLQQLAKRPEVSFSKTTVQESTANEKENSYVAPRNSVELTLVEIWEQLFGINYISITDSFFYLGGKSLLSVKMFALIEQKLKVKLPPTTLLESPTIKDLSALIISNDGNEIVTWKYLVPIKTKGDKKPLFCIHAGGGHVFFYKPLADAISKERPVYALQPSGIFGEEDKHQSIQAMAKDYSDEIKSLQKEGVLNIVVYCFSTAVGLEMANYLKSQGRETHLIVADTIAEHRLLLDKERLQIRVSAFLKRFFSNPFKALNEMIGFRILFYLKPLKVKLFGSDAEKNTENMRLHLVNLFNAYQWKSKADKVSLVLTEKGDERYNQEIIRSWKPLIKDTFKVEITKGNHKTFFENPDVMATANAMEKTIIE